MNRYQVLGAFLVGGSMIAGKSFLQEFINWHKSDSFLLVLFFFFLIPGLCYMLVTSPKINSFIKASSLLLIIGFILSVLFGLVSALGEGNEVFGMLEILTFIISFTLSTVSVIIGLIKKDSKL